VVDYIKTSYYDYEGEKIDFSKAKDNISQGGSGSNSAAGEPDDDDYLNAKEYVISTQRASASGLQSRFGWGFPKANGMIMKLEDNYVVSQMEGNKRRVLMTLGGNSDADKINDAVEDLF
jgi:DNA segregation ATPase FtsK/SpoIIIE-like protein